MFCDRISSSLWNCKIKIQIINRCLNTPSIFSTLLAWLHIHCVHFNRVYPCFFFFIFFSSFFNFPLCFSLTSLSPVGTMLQCFLFLSLFFFCCFYSTILTTSLSPPLCYFVDCKKKKKKMASRDDRALPLVEPTDLIETTKMRKEEGLPILFVVRGKSFRTEVHRSLFFFLFQIWPCWTRWWTRRNPGTRRGSRIVCFITVPGVCTVSPWKVTVTVTTSTSAGTNRGSSALIATWRASKRRRSTVTSERNIRPRRFAWSISITRRGEKIPLSLWTNLCEVFTDF